MMEHTPIITKEAYRNRINVTYICKGNKEVKELVTACNNFEMAVELLKEFTSGGYICEDCEVRRHTEECSTCKHGIALQLLSEIEGDTIPGNIRSDARKRKTDLGKYRYKCDACKEWFLSPHTWTEGKIVCPYCRTEVMTARGK